MSSFFNQYFSERFPLPSNEKVGLVGEKDADIRCNISECIDIIDDLVNTYEYDVSLERLGAIGELKGVINSRPTFPYSILKDSLFNEKTNLGEKEKKQIMDDLFVLEEGDYNERAGNEVVRPINLNIIDIFFNDSFFDDLQKNTEKTYTPEQKECLKACLKDSVKDINNKQLIKFTPSTLFVSLIGANGVITKLIKELLDRMNTKLQIYRSINRTNVEQEKKNEQEFIKQQKAIEREERLAQLDDERLDREEEHKEKMENDPKYRQQQEQIEKQKKQADLFRKQQFKYETKKSAEEDRIRRLAAKYDEEYNNAIRHIRTDDPLDTRITDEDIYKKNEERIKRQIDDFIKKENDYLGEIKKKYNITEPINSNKVKAYAYAETSNLYKEEINGGKPKKSRKNRKAKKYSKKNKKYKKKTSGKRKKQGRKTRRNN
jgi:hypothetical protein